MNIPPGTLLTYSHPWPGASLLGFLQLGEGQTRVYWESEKSSHAFAGLGIAAQITGEGATRFEQISHHAGELFDKICRIDQGVPAEADPILAGGFSFRERDGRHDPFWSAFSDASFILPQTQLTRIAGESWLTLNHVLAPGEEAHLVAASLCEEAQDLIWQGLPGDFASPGEDDFSEEHTIFMRPYTSYEAWSQMIQQVTGRIHSGEFEKVVLARTSHAELGTPLCLPKVLARLAARYPDCYRFLIEPEPGHIFFGATPELLANVASRQLHTAALAGSTPRGETWQEDQQLGQQLLANPKERSEHELVVRALRENLTPLCNFLDIPEKPELCLLNNIQHLFTPVVGQLANGRGIVPVVQALHPTPALGGAPRGVALPVIETLEPLPRGWYGAPIGWLKPNGEGEFAVAIRSAVIHQNRIRLYAGAGIVADSEPEKEWRETELKFQPILKALGL